MSRYITVRLTEIEAQSLLRLAGDSMYDDDDPEIVRPAERAQKKIVRELAALKARDRRPDPDPAAGPN